MQTVGRERQLSSIIPPRNIANAFIKGHQLPPPPQAIPCQKRFALPNGSTVGGGQPGVLYHARRFTKKNTPRARPAEGHGLL